MPAPLKDEARDLLLDDANDLVIEGGDFVFARGIEAIAQSCRIVMQMFEGEWFLDQSVGIPYWQQILGFKPAIAMRAARLAFTSELRSVSGVLDVVRMDITYDNVRRSMNVTWQVSTTLGNTPVDTIALAVTRSGVE